MPYPKQIITMAQNFIDESEENVELQESRFYMLWNSILNLHFPLTLGYGIAPQTSITGTGTKQDFFVIVEIIGELVDLVVVVELNSSSDETKAQMDTLQAELVEFIKERFSQTQCPTIYGIGCVGLSWTALKVDKDSNQPVVIVPRRTLVTSNESFSHLKAVADEVYGMTRVWS